MDEDDIIKVALDLHDFLVDLGRVPNECEDYDALRNLLSDKLAPFITKERNYN
jgi:hypothetical protein